MSRLCLQKLSEIKNLEYNCSLLQIFQNGEKTIVRASSYSLQHANFSNDGNYTCRVNTDQGSESRNYVVDVGYEPIFIMPPSPIFIWNGDVREKLNCNVRAKPQENVSCDDITKHTHELAKYFHKSNQINYSLLIGFLKQTKPTTKILIHSTFSNQSCYGTQFDVSLASLYYTSGTLMTQSAWRYFHKHFNNPLHPLWR